MNISRSISHNLSISCFKILMVLFFINQPAVPQNLKLYVTPLKEIYITGEPVEVGVSIKNISNMKFKPDLFESVQIRIFQENGKELRYKGPTADRLSPFSEELEPEEEVCRVIELNRYYGTKIAWALDFAYFDPGRYLVKIYFEQESVTVDSLSLSFNVVNPEGEELLAFNGLKRIISYLGTSQYNEQRFIAELRALADDNPNSVYLPSMLETLHAWYNIIAREIEKVYSIEKEIIDKCYKYGLSDPFIDTFLRNTKSKSEKLERLKELKVKAKNTVMERCIDKKIKKESKN